MDRSDETRGHASWKEPVREPVREGTARSAGRAEPRREQDRRADASRAEEQDTSERESEGTPREEGSRMSDIMKRVNEALHRARRKEKPEE